MRKFYLFFVFVSLYSVGASAQIEGYYRVRNNGGGVDGKAYLNVQNERLEPTMTSDDVVSATNSVFYLKTGEKQGSNGLTTHNYYQVETFTSQGVDGQKMFKDIKATMQNKLLVNQLTFNAAWGIFKAALSADETVKEQIDKINNAYGINLDDFTYEEYLKWVETFDTNLYVEEVNTTEQILLGKGHRLYINFPDLPDPLRKGDSQDDLNTAMLLIGPLMKATIKNSIDNTLVVKEVFNENNTPGIFMMLDVLERIQFGKRLYLIEDDDIAKISFAHEGEISLGSLVDLGTITKAGKRGIWTLQSFGNSNTFALKMDGATPTPYGTYLTTFYSEFPYRLNDNLKAYVAEEITTTGSALSGGVKGHLSPKLIAAQGEVVPAKTPVIIETLSTEPTDNEIIPTLSDATFEGTNKLSGTLTGESFTAITSGLYRVLGTDSNTPAFVTPGGLVVSISENTAYFESSSLPTVNVVSKPTVVYIEMPIVVIKPAKEKTTFCSTQNLDFTGSGLKAYVVSEITSTRAILKQVNKVKAGTGLILIGTAGQEYFVRETDETEDIEKNLLVGTTKATTIRAGEAYLLSDGVFKKSTSTGSFLNPGTTLAAGKAYLPASAVPATAREFTVVFEDMTTAITTVNEDATATGNAVIYDLNGQRVTAPGKGIYIVRGKKIVIK